MTRVMVSSSSRKSGGRRKSSRKAERGRGSREKRRKRERAYPTPPSRLDKHDVVLNVYDVTHDPMIRKLNSALSLDLVPDGRESGRGKRKNNKNNKNNKGRGGRKRRRRGGRVWKEPGTGSLGGAYHSGIEIRGKEWSYGLSEPQDRGSGKTGVFAIPPMRHPSHSYRCSVYLGRTSSGWLGVKRILSDLKSEWVGDEYHLLERNCNVFCQALADRLGVLPPPPWVNRWARAASSVTRNGKKALGLGLGLGLLAAAAAVALATHDDDDDDDDTTHTSTQTTQTTQYSYEPSSSSSTSATS